MDWLGRLFIRASGPLPPGTPAWRVQEAYLKMVEAGKRNDNETMNEAYLELSSAAEEGNLYEVMAACNAWEAAIDAQDDRARKNAVHQVTVSVYNLKHRRFG